MGSIGALDTCSMLRCGMGTICPSDKPNSENVLLRFQVKESYNKELTHLPLLGWAFRLFFSLGGSAPQTPQTVGLRPPRLADLYSKSHMNQGGRRPTIPGGLGGGAPQSKKVWTHFWPSKQCLEQGTQVTSRSWELQAQSRRTWPSQCQHQTNHQPTDQSRLLPKPGCWEIGFRQFP